MNVAAFQMDIAWESPRANREKVSEWIGKKAGDADLIVLPEMFSTGFSMAPERVAEDMSGPTVQWLRETAMDTSKALVGSIALRSVNRETGETGYFNRLLFALPDGRVEYYDKRHLFRMGEEDKHYTGGTERVVVEYKGFRILLLICYDLRFPVWSRNRNDYDLMIYIANWPVARAYVWKTLLRARAMENLSYVIGVNRCGADPALRYSGDTVILDFKGEPLAEAQPDKEQMIFAGLETAPLNEFRKKFPAHLDADRFDIRL